MPDPLQHVRHILTAAETGAPLAPSTVQWLAAGFQAITWDTRRRLEAALGITARGGLPGMSRQQRMDARDRMLQELRALFYREASGRQAARAILNLRDAMVRSAAAPDSDAEVLLDSIINIGLPLPAERQLARVLGE